MIMCIRVEVFSEVIDVRPSGEKYIAGSTRRNGTLLLNNTHEGADKTCAESRVKRCCVIWLLERKKGMFCIE